MFERTAVGQQNRALFYSVDYICYVEGGGGCSDRSADCIFWEQVLSTFRPDIKFVFLARGGKPVLESLARKVQDDNIKNTVVAMDGDYDRVTGNLIVDPRVLYSYGYSWENDIYDIAYINELVRHISLKPSLRPEIIAYIESCYSAFAESVHRLKQVDLLAFIAGSSVMPRDASGRIIKSHPETSTPNIDKSEILKLVKEANRRTRPRSGKLSPELPAGLRYFVGHCLSYAISLIVKATLKEMGVRKAVSSDHMRDVGMLLFSRQLTDCPESAVASYHRYQCGAF